MKGWLGKYQDMGVAIYLTPDGKHAISGYMYDENGSNLSEQLFRKNSYTPAGQEMWKKMASAHWLQDGRKGRPYRAVCLCRSLLSLLQTVLAAIPPLGRGR